MSGFFTIKIEDKEKSVSFGPRRLGDKGLDILAVKIALGLILSTESITNESPQDPAIKEGGKQWFSCTENKNISLEQVIFSGFKGVNTFKKSELETQKATLKLKKKDLTKVRPGDGEPYF